MERENLTLNTLVTRIGSAREGDKNLSGAVRVFVFGYFYALARQQAPSVPLGYESRTYN
jgi:predicted DNA-binding ribbon-helix-helix protein